MIKIFEVVRVVCYSGFAGEENGTKFNGSP